MAQIKKEEIQTYKLSQCLNIHNQGSQYQEYFELNAPYMFFYEISQPSNNFFEMRYISPCENITNQIEYSDYRNYRKHLIPHQHNFFEIMFVLEGEVIQSIENKSYLYNVGQCCILNRNIKHVEEFSGNYEAVFISLTNNFLQQMIERDICYGKDGNNQKHFNELYRLIQENEKSNYFTVKEFIDYVPISDSLELIKICKELLNHMMEETKSQKPGYFLIVEGLLSRFFSLLADESLFLKTINRLTGKNEDTIFIKITRVLEENHGKVKREELAEQLNYNDDYLNRIVKKFTGMTLNEYKQIFCLNESRRLLLESDKSISEIIQLLGFSNRSYFYRMFSQKYGMTPKEYRECNLTEL